MGNRVVESDRADSLVPTWKQIYCYGGNIRMTCSPSIDCTNGGCL